MAFIMFTDFVYTLPLYQPHSPPLPLLPPPSWYHPQEKKQQQQWIKRSEVLKDDHKTVSRVTWKFPGENRLKMNTDGSSKGNPGPSSFGGLIRDNSGRWVCGYMGKMKGESHTSLEAEVWSIYKGLCLIKDKRLQNVFIETDCQGAILLVIQPLEDSHPLKSVIDDIKALLMECNCVMFHTKREGNKVADQLAKLGGTQTEDYCELDSPPFSLISYLVQDALLASRHDNQQQ